MRGRALLDAHLHDLEADYGFLTTATEVVVSGTSAGGMSTYMHSSYIASQLKAPGARLVVSRAVAPHKPASLGRCGGVLWWRLW